jgi:hypothetical protein
MDVIAVLWGSCGPSAKLVAVDVLLLKWVRCVYNSLPGFGLQFFIRYYMWCPVLLYTVWFFFVLHVMEILACAFLLVCCLVLKMVKFQFVLCNKATL